MPQGEAVGSAEEREGSGQAAGEDQAPKDPEAPTVTLPTVEVTAPKIGDAVEDIAREKNRPKTDNTRVVQNKEIIAESHKAEEEERPSTLEDKIKDIADLTDIAFAELGFTHYLPKKLIFHYGTYSGKTYKLSAQEMKDVNPVKFGIVNFKKTEDILKGMSLGESVRITEGVH